jgi:hypothetical protein
MEDDAVVSGGERCGGPPRGGDAPCPRADCDAPPGAICKRPSCGRLVDPPPLRRATPRASALRATPRGTLRATFEGEAAHRTVTLLVEETGEVVYRGAGDDDEGFRRAVEAWHGEPGDIVHAIPLPASWNGVTAARFMDLRRRGEHGQALAMLRAAGWRIDRALPEAGVMVDLRDLRG